MGSDHHDVAGVSAARLSDDVAACPVLTVVSRHLIGRGAHLEAGAAQHADHVLDARVVAGVPVARLPPCSSAIFCNACMCFIALASLTWLASCRTGASGAVAVDLVACGGVGGAVDGGTVGCGSSLQFRRPRPRVGPRSPRAGA